VDRHRRAVQEGRAHARGEGDEGLLLAGLSILTMEAALICGLFGADDVQAGKAGLCGRAQIDHLRALDEAARLEVDAASCGA
jgi:hypothetical protein